jgi:toxin ParE1/3/4
MPQFFLSQPAIRDIEDIADFIASQQSLQQAEEFLAKLDDKFARMTQFPESGSPPR